MRTPYCAFTFPTTDDELRSTKAALFTMSYFTKPHENQLIGSPTGGWDKSTSQTKFSTSATATLPSIRIISSGAPKSFNFPSANISGVKKQPRKRNVRIPL